MRYSTTKIRPFENIALDPEVLVRAFDSRGIAWKKSSLSWLDYMREQRFGLIEGHTLEVRSDCLSQNFIILAVERSTAPVKPLPPRIYFAHFELEFWSGHDIHVDCDEVPPAVTVNHHFWEQREGEGKTPHFETHVLPLIDELVSRFRKGELWAS